jgi:hypothetical protein
MQNGVVRILRSYVLISGGGLVRFASEGAEAYRKDLMHVELHMLDAGHFALETNASEIAAFIRGFRALRE